MCQKCPGIDGTQPGRLVVDGIRGSRTESGLAGNRVVAAGDGVENDGTAACLQARQAIEHGIEVAESSVLLLCEQRSDARHGWSGCGRTTDAFQRTGGMAIAAVDKIRVVSGRSCERHIRYI